MPRRIGIAVLLLVVGVVIGVTLRPNIAAEPPKDEKKEKPIPINEVRKRGVLGDLGHPLGTIVTIEGEAADESYRKLKADSGHTLLRIKFVNGTELKDEVVFRFDGKKEDAPKVGAKFKYVGHESACYYGIVDGEFKYTPAYAFVGYWFHGSFRILKDELKPEKK
jgi:hypothetical protein